MDAVWTATFSLAVGVGLAAAAGLRIFVPLLVLGLAAQFEWVPLAEGFEWLAGRTTIGILALALALEVAAYGVPWLDNLLDSVAVPAATMAGILATAAVLTDVPPEVRWALALIAGGGAAGVVQSLTSIARLTSTAATGGVANPALALLELVGAAMTSMLAVLVPLLALVLSAVLIVVIRRLVRRRPQAVS